MTDQQIVEMNRIVSDINSVLVGKQCEITGQHEFKPLLRDFKLCMNQPTVFGSDVVFEDGVCIDKFEICPRTLIIKRTISACDRMIDALKIHVGKLEDMLK